MKIGVVLVLYAKLPLGEALDQAVEHGLEAVELGTGNYGGTSHCDPRRVVEDDAYAESILREVRSRNLTLSALSCHGNPLHPQKQIAQAHDEMFRWTCQAASRLGVDTVTLFSGCPGDRQGGTTPNWVTCPWPPEYSELYDWQWHEVAFPYWAKAVEFANSAGVHKLGFEMHPGMIVYNPATLLRLREAVGETIGANLDPSHLFWQGIDVIKAVRALGQAIYHVHAKDCAVDTINAEINGVLDAKPYSDEIHRAWLFRTVGYGHGVEFWKQFVSALRLVGYDYVLSVEHEDSLMSVDEGLTKAVRLLKEAVISDPPAAMWWA